MFVLGTRIGIKDCKTTEQKAIYYYEQNGRISVEGAIVTPFIFTPIRQNTYRLR